MSKFTTMAFYEGGCGSLTGIVGRKDLFKSKKDFLDWCMHDCDELESDFSFLDENPEFTTDDISEDFIRYYPRMPEGFEIESGWTFCKKGRGAIEVYVLNVA
ncbi:hypothetical protein SAMN05446037_1006112 [Anaerovirgula multivorans]|uniref:Uncharacterized protein n=1 Tax=Anaerovirgula multivorans TaxID=312168 RepID=A0A239CTH8_9FIRM|nr:hypothetical protein [Anaerovirgula multivorans]SNS22673.1 hypothetical protein SAMN05446037_1006112 [Anaerovirgula multivorans]